MLIGHVLLMIYWFNIDNKEVTIIVFNFANWFVH